MYSAQSVSGKVVVKPASGWKLVSIHVPSGYSESKVVKNDDKVKAIQYVTATLVNKKTDVEESPSVFFDTGIAANTDDRIREFFRFEPCPESRHLVIFHG